MKIDRDNIRALKLEYFRRSKDAAQKLIEDGNLEGAKADLEWIETSSYLIAITEKSNRARLSVIIAFVCLLTAGLTWSLHVNTTQVSFEVVTKNVSLTLSESWTSRCKFTPDSVHVNNVENLNAPGLKLPIIRDSQKELTTISLEGKKISVQGLHLSSGAKVELNSADGKHNLFVKNSSLKGEFYVEEASLKIETADKSNKIPINAEPPETIDFATAKTSADPVLFELVLGGKNKWQIYGFKVTDINFLEENPPGSGNFESVILSGKVKLPEFGQVENLRKWDRLTLKGVQSRRIELSNVKNEIHIFFEGTASEILVGPKAFEKNLTPTYLEYFYHQKRLAFFWSIVLFLWGMLWSVKNTIFKEGFEGKG